MGLFATELKAEFRGHQIAAQFYAYGNKGKLYLDGEVVDTSESIASKKIAPLRCQLKLEEQAHILEVYATNRLLGFLPHLEIYADGKKIA
jgi:hypothetical protein